LKEKRKEGILEEKGLKKEIRSVNKGRGKRNEVRSKE
jgi:hypothetical protein